MLYHMYELNHAVMTPLRSMVGIGQVFLKSPLNPLSYTLPGRNAAATLDVIERATRRYGKPRFDIDETSINGQPVKIRERTIWRDTWCQVKHFERDPDALRQARGTTEPDPKLLIIAPLSGHYATLLSETAEAMLPDHDVYITDWVDARTVPIWRGRFDLNDYIDYLLALFHFLGPNLHVMAVCQPGPAALAATALLAEDNNPNQPASLILMGSPIDTRKSPTAPNLLAQERPLHWFKDRLIMTVPPPHPGAVRRVYPGFIQLSGFMAMNMESHVEAHWKFFDHLIAGDGDSADKHRRFYDEYLSVMDLSEEYYLQTIDEIFQRHLLPRHKFKHRGRLVRPESIRTTALMTIEGENDDISGIGQTQAAHELCVNIPARRQTDYVQLGVGHYGVFNGSRYRKEIAPRIRDFIWSVAKQA